MHVPSVDAEAEQLSGGQRQAVAVARAVRAATKILLLDEPLAAMGARESRLIIDLVKDLAATGRVSIIVIDHNYAHLFELCDRINVMQGGRITTDQRGARDVARGADRADGLELPPASSTRSRARGPDPWRRRTASRRRRSATSRSGSSPAARSCTGRRHSGASRSTRGRSRRVSMRRPTIPVRVVYRRGRHEPRIDPADRARGERRRIVPRRDRLDAHLLAGEDVDRGARRAAEAAPPSPHAVRSRPAVGGDRHGLHEPEPVGARRPRVRVPRDADGPAPKDGRRPLARPASRGADRRLGARGGGLARGAVRSASPASGTTCARSR